MLNNILKSLLNWLYLFVLEKANKNILRDLFKKFVHDYLNSTQKDVKILKHKNQNNKTNNNRLRKIRKGNKKKTKKLNKLIKNLRHLNMANIQV